MMMMMEFLTMLTNVPTHPLVWLPGTEGDGISDILFGDFQSSGKLSYPWPIKAEYGANAEDKDLLFNFGFGL